jgi:3-deoxy-D-manno-octulosonate 8-phosphate phosphatase (KDO 8-P phosphatase)
MAGRVPALSFAPELLLAAPMPASPGPRAAIFDVDGVLTDGRVYIGADGEVVKAFATLDGQGLKLLAAGGIVPIVVTGRDSPAVRRRMADLGIGHTAYGADDKLAAANDLLAALGLGWERVAAMGDDWPDLPILRRAACVTWWAAAREFCDLLLVACGRYAELLDGPLVALDGTR